MTMASPSHSRPHAPVATIGAKAAIWRWSGLLIGLVALGIYLLVPTKEFYWDGVGFSLTIESSKVSLGTLFQPNHLIYNLMGYGVWRALSSIGIEVRALFLLQTLNALFAAG